MLRMVPLPSTGRIILRRRQRRFDILASETAAWAATGVEALLTLGDAAPKAAAAALADELDRAQAALARVLRA